MARGQENLYVDVSAVRIQDWLARTPDLKLRRGASVLLSEATARDEWEKNPPPGTEWNDEAGDVDGVVSLVVTDGTGDPDRAAVAAAREVAGRIREKMPHCQVRAVAGRGEAYAAAYERMEQARRDGRLLLDAPPAVPEVILAKPCDKCRSAAALRAHEHVVIIAGDPDEDDHALCGECFQRLKAAGRTKGDGLHRLPRPEQRMIAALSGRGVTVAGFSDNFAAMAAAGRKRQDDAPSQLALIFADGNRVGAFLHEALTATPGRTGTPVDKSDIARAIDRATMSALAAAVLDRFAGWRRPPVLANLVGGDDLLISVPAADAWLFTRALLDGFGAAVRHEARAWPSTVRAKSPTLSAGLVFHQLKHPFSDAVRLAEHELRRAKRKENGTAATVSFLDLTADGGQPPPGREPVPLAFLDEQAGNLERLEQCHSSRRETLLALLRQKRYGDAIRRVTDLDNQPLWDAVTGHSRAAPDEARDTLSRELEETGGLGGLRLLLDIARHWTTQPRREDT